MWTKYFNSWVKNEMKYSFLIFCLLSVAGIHTLWGQHFHLVEDLHHVKGFVGIDAMQNIYSLENGVLSKYGPKDEQVQYSNFQWGHITEVDVTDPLNIIVVFGDFGRVALLDRNLTQKNVLEGPFLQDSSLPGAICYSSKHGFWAFFPNTFTLARFNFRGEASVVSNDLSLTHPQMGEVAMIKESNDKLFLLANGIWVFDLHANFLFSIDHIQTEDFQVKGNNIFYIQDNVLYVYDFFVEKENVFLLPEKTVSSFFVKDSQTVFLQTDVSLKVFQAEDKIF